MVSNLLSRETKEWNKTLVEKLFSELTKSHSLHSTKYNMQRGLFHLHTTTNKDLFSQIRVLFSTKSKASSDNHQTGDTVLGLAEVRLVTKAAPEDKDVYVALLFEQPSNKRKSAKKRSTWSYPMRKVWSWGDSGTHSLPLCTSHSSVRSVPMDRSTGPSNLLLLQKHLRSLLHQGQSATDWNTSQHLCLDLLEHVDQQKPIHLWEQTKRTSRYLLQRYCTSKRMGICPTSTRSSSKHPPTANPGPDLIICLHRLLLRCSLE